MIRANNRETAFNAIADVDGLMIFDVRITDDIGVVDIRATVTSLRRAFEKFLDERDREARND